MSEIFDKQGLVAHLKKQVRIDWLGHHGITHWMRVRANGLMLARQNGTNVHVIELFAFFHDARRMNEYKDEGHGDRGALLAERLRGRYFTATDHEMDLLVTACQDHSDGELQGDLTVMTCWDADRLDLGRVGIVPNPRYLCTDVAKQEANLHQANARAHAWQRNYLARSEPHVI
jgi:uncharacterized protein